MAGRRGSGAAGVSGREGEVLAALGEHLSNAEIAARLFISVRTVESHVSALLRKLGVADRRELAARANDSRAGSAGLPSPLTPFVGRTTERAALADAVTRHRLVTAVGPGGVGKTRLALAVAGDIGERFADGVHFVDLIPVTDDAMIATAIADALGLVEQPGRAVLDAVSSWVADRGVLLVLDNCEHVLDGVVVLLERLLAASGGLTVLATSRARLLVPFEWVFPVPGMSVGSDGGDGGDAAALFLGRVAASGTRVPDGSLGRVAAICRALDGMALAIELAAARYTSLGLDGLEAGLSHRLPMLTGGPRVDDRHRSLRSALDWSYALLSAPEQEVLRRVSVFAQPFTASAVQAMWTGRTDSPAQLLVTLAALADQSLLVASAEGDGTRYRALETIRQYGLARLTEADELTEARTQHLRWCLDVGIALEDAARTDTARWRDAFGAVADELRAALAWVAAPAADAAVPSARASAHRLALVLASLTFQRGLLGEAQRRYEQASALAPDDRAAADALRSASGAAESRHFGDEALRLRRAAARIALAAGDRAGAAADLAVVAERINRGPGLLSGPVGADEAQALIAEAQQLAGGDPAADVRVLVARAFGGDDDDPQTLRLTLEALELARRLADPQAESAALDQLTSTQLALGDVGAAAASAARRVELLTPLPVAARTGFELFDAYVMASECAIAAGDFPSALRLATGLNDLPFYREEGHLATSRLIVVTALAGDWAQTVALAERFRRGWDRAGRPTAGNLSRGAYAAATVHGLRGDDEARRSWLDVVAALETPGRPLSTVHVGEFFDALLHLHRGRPDLAGLLMGASPEEFRAWFSGMWRPWYAAAWAEAAVLTGSASAADRIRRARVACTGNPIATGIVDRAAALADGDRDGLTVAAAVLAGAGCRYQWARTLVMIGGEHGRRGETVLEAMGATPMAWPPG